MEKIKVTMDGQVYEVDKFSAITEFVHAHMQAFQARKASGCKMQAHTSAYSPAYARVQIP